MIEEQLNTRYLEMQMLAQQTKQAEQQIQQLDMQVAELNKIIEDLNDIKKTEKGTEIFAPLTAGIFAKAKIEDTNELLVNVGSNIAVKKTIDESKDLINRQISEIGNIRDDMITQLKKLDEQALLLEEDVLKSKLKK